MITRLDQIWSNINNFSMSEFQPGLENMDMGFICFLDKFRDSINSKIIITRAFGAGSVPGSLHPEGTAVDVWIPGLSAYRAFQAALRFKYPGHSPGVRYNYFGGIGVYVGVWSDGSGNKIEGLHLDVRFVEMKTALWGALPLPETMGIDEYNLFESLYYNHDQFKRTYKQIYVPMDFRFWTLYGRFYSSYGDR